LVDMSRLSRVTGAAGRASTVALATHSRARGAHWSRPRCVPLGTCATHVPAAAGSSPVAHPSETPAHAGGFVLSLCCGFCRRGPTRGQFSSPHSGRLGEAGRYTAAYARKPLVVAADRARDTRAGGGVARVRRSRHAFVDRPPWPTALEMGALPVRNSRSVALRSCFGSLLGFGILPW
jgi:hypothetical protein